MTGRVVRRVGKCAAAAVLAYVGGVVAGQLLVRRHLNVMAGDD